MSVAKEDKQSDKEETIMFFQWCGGSSCLGDRGACTMFSVLFVWLLGICSARAFLPVTPLMDCPKISPPKEMKIEKVTGTWRLAYLFIDDNDELEEDNTCAVAEIMQVNETQLEMLLYVDGRKDEFTIDRYTKEFDITILTPGEWLLHTSFTSMEFIHVTVIGFTSNHLILTFCVDPFTGEDKPPTTKPEPVNDYDSFMNLIDRDSMDDVFKAQNYNRFFKDMDEVNGRLGKQRRLRRPSRLLRGKRSSKFPQEESRYEKMMKYLNDSNGSRPRKHLWTAILAKDNNVSALRFVENASLLMKFGFKIKEGDLVSFGSCELARK